MHEAYPFTIIMCNLSLFTIHYQIVAIAILHLPPHSTAYDDHDDCVLLFIDSQLHWTNFAVDYKH